MNHFKGIAIVVFSSSIVQAQSSFNIEYLGNWNGRPTPVGPYSPYSACWGYTAPDGREYAFLGSTLGTSVLDITDAPTIVEVAFIPGPSSNWREMKTYQEYAYVVSEGSAAEGNGVQIIDLSTLPDTASLVTTYVSGEARAHTVSIEGKYLYLNGGGSTTGIRILDLTNPTSPTNAGQYAGPYVHDCYVRNDTIFAAAIYGVGLDIVDATNKTSPSRIKLVQYPGAGTHNAWTTEDGNYVFTTDEIGSTPKTLKVWDIQDLQNPTKVAEVASVNGTDTAIVHNVVVKGNLAYAAWYTAGVKIFDISNPTSPQLVARYDTYPLNDTARYAGAWGVYPFYPSGKIIVCDMQTGLYVMRYSPPLVSVDPELPVAFTLHQNFPNPFNPSTTIAFDLPTAGHVSAKVFNSVGQECLVLAEGEFLPGRHFLHVIARSLPSGVYVYRIHTAGRSAARKMMVVK